MTDELEKETIERHPGGRPRVYEDLMTPIAIKLPDYMVDWLGRGNGPITASERLRDIITRATLFVAEGGELPNDPGPGRIVRSSYTLSDDLVQDARTLSDSPGYVIGLRRAIRADMAGMLG